MLSTTIYFSSTGVNNLYLLTWFAPIPLILYVLKTSSVYIAGFAGVIVYFVGFSSSLIAYSNTIIPISMLIFSNMFNAIGFTIILLIFRHMARTREHWVWSYVFASGWTVYEFITSLHSPGGTFGSIAYSQVSNLPIIQIASVTGIWGIVFILNLIPASIALGWHYRSNKNLCYKAISVPIGILVLILMFGFYRLNSPLQGPSIKVGMAAINMNLEQLRWHSLTQEVSKVDRYIVCIDELSRLGAEIVLLPEKIVTINLNEQADLLQRFADAAQEHNIYIVAGVSVQDEANLYNSAYLFSPNGERVQQYDKQHLLPFSEGRYTPGKELSIRKVEDKGIWGMAICKDMDFEQPSRGYAQQGINLLLVPALDFKTDEWLHAQIAIMQGVEGNFAVARAAQWGLLTLSSNKGDITAITSTETSSDDILLIGKLQLGQGQSLYGRWGNWFGYFSGALFILLMVFYATMWKCK